MGRNVTLLVIHSKAECYLVVRATHFTNAFTKGCVDANVSVENISEVLVALFVGDGPDVGGEVKVVGKSVGLILFIGGFTPSGENRGSPRVVLLVGETDWSDVVWTD